MWLMPLTTANKAPNVLSANVIMLALMQCILNLIVHNLPSLKASLKVRHNLWLCGVGTLTDSFHPRRKGTASSSLVHVPDGFAQDRKDISAPSQGLSLLFLTFVASHILRWWNIMRCHGQKWLNLELGKKSEPGL